MPFRVPYAVIGNAINERDYDERPSRDEQVYQWEHSLCHMCAREYADKCSMGCGHRLCRSCYAKRERLFRSKDREDKRELAKINAELGGYLPPENLGTCR